MSFSTLIKNEITRIDNTRSENIAELSAFIRNNAEISKDEFKIVTENAAVARRIFKLLKDLYGIVSIITVRKVNLNKHNMYILLVKDKTDMILKDLSIIDDDNNYLINPSDYISSDDEEKRAYLRGIFLAVGSVNDPKTARYHLEFLISKKEQANFLSNLLNEYDLNSKIFKRTKGYMVYIKEAEKVGDFLRIINAPQAVLYFEDIRIYRDHKNMTNRLNNCEQANIDKTISVANQQIEDINYLKETVGFDIVDDKLQEVIDYRLKYPDSSLTELSDIISIETGKKITKSGLNHRFRKIKKIVETIKNNIK
jgi:DNA-binding protein WhiA